MVKCNYLVTFDIAGMHLEIVVRRGKSIVLKKKGGGARPHLGVCAPSPIGGSGACSSRKILFLDSDIASGAFLVKKFSVYTGHLEVLVHMLLEFQGGGGNTPPPKCKLLDFLSCVYTVTHI